MQKTILTNIWEFNFLRSHFNPQNLISSYIKTNTYIISRMEVLGQRHTFLVDNIWKVKFCWIMKSKEQWLMIKELEGQMEWGINERTIHLKHLTMKEGRKIRKVPGEEWGQWIRACLHKEGTHVWNNLLA